MKKRLFYLLPLLALLLITTIGMTSCEEEVDFNPKKMKYVLAVNPEPGDSTYDMAFFNSKGSMSFLTLNDNGKISQEDILSDNGQSRMSITYYDNGLVRSISNDMGSLVFANYSGNKVDIAMVGKDGNFEIAKECEGSVNWDEVVAQAASGPRKASSFDEFAARVAEYGNQIRDFNQKHEAAYFVVDQVTGISGVTRAGMKGIESKIKKELKDWGWNTSSGAFDLAVDNVYAESALFAVDLAIASGPWGIALTLVKNYDKLEDMFTNVFYNFRVWIDELNQEGNVNLGVAALSTGMGALKVTLAWNFYADIDLHAIEPNGTHIFYNHKHSSVTGGFLDLDNRYGYPGSAENIYWTTPEDGTYDIYLNYYSPSLHDGEAQCGNCNVTILYQGHGQVFKIPMDAVGDTKRVAVIDMPSGTIGATSQWGPKINLHLVPKPVPTTTERHASH